MENPMSNRTKRIIAVFIIVCFALIFLKESNRGNKYVIGTRIQEVKKELNYKYQVKGLLVDTEYDIPKDKINPNIALCYIYDEDEGVILYFNKDDALIKKDKIKYMGINIVTIRSIMRNIKMILLVCLKEEINESEHKHSNIIKRLKILKYSHNRTSMQKMCVRPIVVIE